VQSSRVHHAFAWLAVDPASAKPGQRLTASIDAQTITLDTGPEPRPVVSLRLSDDLVDLDRPIRVIVNGEPRAETTAKRTVASLARSLTLRADCDAARSATVGVAP
jgi:hypothetical protein